METPTNLGAAFVRSTKPKSNCRLERTTYEMTAPSGSPLVSRLFIYISKHTPALISSRMTPALHIQKANYGCFGKNNVFIDIPYNFSNPLQY